MSTDENTPSTPQWLDDQFLKLCITGDDKNINTRDVKIAGVQLKYVVPKGENYSSTMFRVIINGCQSDEATNDDAEKAHRTQRGSKTEGDVNKERRYIVKAALSGEGDATKEMMESWNVFPREKEMYTSMLPALSDILDKAGLPKYISPRCIYIDDVRDIIVLEDLAQLGYRSEDRIKGFDLEHFRMVFTKLAHFHGSSMRFHQLHPQKLTAPIYKRGTVMNGDNCHDFMSPSHVAKLFQQFAEDLKTRPGYEVEAQYMATVSDGAFDILCELFEYSPENICNALQHGDSWVNNILFKKDTKGHPKDMVFLDFQLSNYNSVANDIIYLFALSASLEVLDNHFDELIHHYVDNLHLTLNKVGYTGIIPTYLHVKEEIRQRSLMFMLLMRIGLPIVKMQLKEEEKNRGEQESLQFDQVVSKTDEQRENALYFTYLFKVMDLLKREKLFCI